MALADVPAPAPTAAASPADVSAAATSIPQDVRLAALLDPAQADVTLELTFGEAHQTLHRSDLAALVATDGGQSRLDSAALRDLAARLADQWDESMVNARFSWNGGALTPIRNSQEGRTLDQVGAAAAIARALLNGDTAVSLPGSIVPPQVSSDNPEKLGITTNLDRGGTSFAGAIPEKAQNIRLAAERLNGVVIPPGGVFSFNQEVGPTTLNAGFEWGFGIEASAGGARTVPSVAGGICQVATTLFQRVFWAGFPLVERHWHLYWIPAYTSRGMVGLDATVDEDSGLDFRWSNPTDGYILIQSATDDSNVYFGLYGSPRNWKVSVDEPRVTNRVAADPGPVAQAEPSLAWGRILPVEAARDGFDVAITRTVTREDGQPRALTLESKYEPSRTVTLVGTKDKPAGADVDAVLARVAPPTRVPARPAATPAPVETNAPAPGSSVAPERSAQGTATPASQPASPTTATSAPASTATPVRTAVPPTATAPTRAVATPTSTSTSATKPAASPQPTPSPTRR